MDWIGGGGENGILSLSWRVGWFRWWKDVVNNVTGVEGGWFWKNLERRIGNGRDKDLGRKLFP